uniref:Pheromone-binding protein-related protein 2 n=2 Tax=Lygus hesperus TaxID=30085 RepID=A0A146L449_LYGHE
MKFVLSAAVVLLVAAAVKANEKKANEKVTEIFNKCKETWPVTDEEIEQVKQKQSIPESKNVKCILACMLKEAKILRDGEYNKENAELMADVLYKDEPEHAEKSKQIIEMCSSELGTKTEGDDCEYAYKMSVCASKHAKELGVKTPEF